MFTGIIETIGTVTNLEHEGSNVQIFIESPLTNELKIDQSLAHNGVCLTVVETNGSRYKVTAVAETISKSNLGNLKIGDKVNLERSLKVGERLDGHFVQGHVDTTGVCINTQALDGSWLFDFSFPPDFSDLVIEKGSITINGVSLTAYNIMKNQLTVSIIPYTYHNTNFASMKVGSIINIEFDVLGKYILKSLKK